MNNIKWNEMKNDIFPNLTRPPKDYVPPSNLNKTTNTKKQNGHRIWSNTKLDQ